MNTVDLLVKTLDQAYDKRSWHGTNLRGSIRGLTPAQAAWRPALKRHNIWEVVVHAAYWKYTVRRRLTGEKRGSFPLKGSDWFTRPLHDPNEADWQADISLLAKMHADLRSAVLRLKPADLVSQVRGSDITVGWLVTGVVSHDLYHAGQIQLIKRLQQ